MAVPVIVVKALATAATDKRFWKLIAIIVAAILVPIIMIVLMLLALFAGTEEINGNLLDYSFKNSAIPSEFTEEQHGAIEDMREWLGELDDTISEKKNADEDYSVDENMVRAVFYSLQFGVQMPTNDDGNEIEFDYNGFCDCFEGLEIAELDTALSNVTTEFPEFTVTENGRMMIEAVYKYLISG